MSAIAKPMIHSVNTVGGIAEPVNVEFLKDMTKLNVPQVHSDLPLRTKYIIQFVVLSTDNQEKNVEWNFGDTAAALVARDAAYVAALAAVSTAV